MIVPDPLSVLVLVVLSLTPVAPAVVVVVVDVSCAKAGPNATAPAAPAANNFINLVCFIVVLYLVKRTFFRSCLLRTCPIRGLFNPSHQSDDTMHPRVSVCFLR